MRLARRNPHQPVAVTQIIVREPAFLRPEQQSHASGLKARPNQFPAHIQPMQRMLQQPSLRRRRPHHQSAVGNSICHARKLFRICQQFGGTHRRPCLAKGNIIAIHHPQAQEPKVAHRARSRADVQGITRGHQHHAQIVTFSLRQQANIRRQRPLAERSASSALPPEEYRSGTAGRAAS